MLALRVEIYLIIYICRRSAVPAVVSSVRLDAAALGTLVHHLSRFELEAFDKFFGRVPFWHSSLGETGERERERSIVKPPNRRLSGRDN